ncbi:GIY-YIG nuclease family protein [Acaryochloris sp. CCMEE 5410]|uniref:GIY-YIG nuclease family protein n=1 Tax=Acaryochloris sp. CCMEE 5410 TaxID=310037 RepID=UPI00024848C5|nr:GIY-YIG nuclease family protein [Acaryochloris sp. CCMEE 5410]KAI9129821.1 GIY-YIG nuclease family protein [Acaryochloris sp. CCMEE 5410]
MDEQSSLFTDLELRDIRFSGSSSPILQMSDAALKEWKARIFRYQTQVNESAATQQGTLFDLAPTSTDPASIDPFSLKQQNTEFWRDTFDDEGIAALYFVIDQELPLLLYVGETSKSNQRWKGVHDCKDYLHNYVAAHRIHKLPVRVTISFWREAPADYHLRQQLEQALIQKWKPPFNRESRKHWGAPFRDLKPD